jgi:aryl-alcohol dehydrogenase-like predicted oxidoreductase
MSFEKFALSSPDTFPSGLGYGCMGLTAFYGAALSDEEAHTVLKAVWDAGCRHFDTAEAYATSEKHNESVLGAFLQTVPRDSYSVATKFWPKEGKYDYETVKKSLTASLQRLQLDFVDLYYAHRLRSKEGAMEFARTAKRLKEEGLIKQVGASEVSSEWLSSMHKICQIDAIQMEWSLMSRSIEQSVAPVCKELSIPIVAYSPLARNLLAAPPTETPNDWRANHPRYSAENLKVNQQVTREIQEIAQDYGCSSAQLSLAWLFHRAKELGVTVVPIPGSTKLPHVKNNFEAININISSEHMRKLEQLADRVAGERANESYMEGTFEAQKS